jgi:hypothetical protein
VFVIISSVSVRNFVWRERLNFEFPVQMILRYAVIIVTFGGVV